ncbi:DUF2000 domain-containing protein [Streptomonospora nanhaiensis]|uniref:DUF2000 domain-containing protein n=1 Tax=Streptomonospora nanhaiensis TaxID=1323731 RepID=A0A853BR72_9ACTN|nr:DUF2000 domain-containing protein [Streptomonospora nanhaiensis]MBX9388659.1 DUF2000 domain-containing protein [Streptomonospora nanhaiensis]NYI97057.1 hypothetical protein [Streptomonospora nanhaiensis]
MALRTKLVLVVDETLPMAHAVNAAMVTGLALGGRLPHLLAADGKDASGGVHAGLNPNPVPVLTAGSADLRALAEAARADDELTVVGFNEVARRSRDYAAYLDALALTPAEEVDYVAVAVFGPRNRVNPLTKRLPLLR